jgi:hypothetical protein
MVFTKHIMSFQEKKINLLKELDKNGTLNVSHYEHLIEKAAQSMGLSTEPPFVTTLEGFLTLGERIKEQMIYSEDTLNHLRTESFKIIETRDEFSDEEKEELKKFFRQKFTDLFNFYAAGTELDLKFAVADNSTTGVPTGGWVPPATGTVLQGKAVISSLDVNAPTDENASFSVVFTGRGPLAVAS